MDEPPTIGPTSSEARFIVSLSIAFALLGGVIASYALLPLRLTPEVPSLHPRWFVWALVLALVFGLGVRRCMVRTGLALLCLAVSIVAVETPPMSGGEWPYAEGIPVFRAPIAAGAAVLLAAIALAVGVVRRGRRAAHASSEADLAADLATLFLAAGGIACALAGLDGWIYGTHVAGLLGGDLGLGDLAVGAGGAGAILLLPRTGWRPRERIAGRLVGTTGILFLAILLVLAIATADKYRSSGDYQRSAWWGTFRLVGTPAWILLALCAASATAAAVEGIRPGARRIAAPMGDLCLGGTILFGALELRLAAGVHVRFGQATTPADLALQRFFLLLLMGAVAWTVTRLPDLLRRSRRTARSTRADRLALAALTVGVLVFAGGTCGAWMALFLEEVVPERLSLGRVRFASRLDEAATILALAGAIYVAHHLARLARALFRPPPRSSA